MFFNGKARHTDFSSGYSRYLGRCKKTPDDRVLGKGGYVDVVRAYCKHLADMLEAEGTIDLPCGIGSIVAVSIRRKPTYDKGRNMWRGTRGDRYTFGFIFSPRRERGYENFRCYGFRANRELYKRMRKKYDDGELPFYLSDKESFL